MKRLPFLAAAPAVRSQDNLEAVKQDKECCPLPDTSTLLLPESPPL